MTKLKFSRQRVNSIVVEEDEVKKKIFIKVNENILLSIDNVEHFIEILKLALKKDESSEIIMNLHHSDLTTRKVKVIFYNKGEFIEINLL